MEENIEKDMKIYYTNATGIEMTNLDIKLKVSYNTKNKLIDLCDIVFSPEQAKLTNIMLGKAIEEYEKRYRKININTDGIEKTEGKEENGGEEQ